MEDALPADAYREIEEIVRAHGYPVQRHTATTEDGYILTIFRIPHGKDAFSKKPATRPAVLLQHGLLDSSFCWFVPEPSNTLPYMLADAGYDVYLGNNRGNRYSTEHVELSNESEEFWQFTLDEMAAYDVKTMLGHIKSTSGQQKVAWIGHSQGTIQLFAALSSEPDIANSLRVFVGLGPLVTVGNTTNRALQVLSETHASELLDAFGVKEFLPTPKSLAGVFRQFGHYFPGACESIIEAIAGPQSGKFSSSRMSVLAAHQPGGCSVKNLMHWAQLVRSGKFSKFDWGEAENLERYGSKTPPLYDTDRIPSTLPIVLYSGGTDALANPKDVKILLQKLAHQNVVHHQQLKEYAHVDFLWAVDARERIYDGMLNFLKLYTEGGADAAAAAAAVLPV